MNQDTKHDMIMSILDQAIESSSYAGKDEHGNYRFKGTKRKLTVFDKALEKFEISSVLEKIGRSDLVGEVISYYIPRLKEKMDKYKFVPDRLDISNSLIPTEQTSSYLDGIKRLKIFRPMNKVPSNFGELLFLNDETNRLLPLSELDPKIVFHAHGIPESEIKASFDIPIVHASFNPLEPKRIYDGYDVNFNREVKMLNLANPPEWRLRMSPDIQPRFRGFIRTLFNHLFVEESERPQVLDWFHYAVASRNQTALVLVGGRGTGKNTMVEILAECIGMEYYESVGQSFVDDKFNSQLLNKRLLNLDEIPVDEGAVTLIKKYANDIVSYESKGKDAVTITNFASFVFISNHKASIRCDPFERRISIPRITDARLETVFESEEIAEIKGQLAAKHKAQWFVDMIAEFSLFLIQWNPTRNVSIPINGEAYFEITEGNFSLWQKLIISHVIEHGVGDSYIGMDDIFSPMEATKRAPINRGKIDDFVSNYRLRNMELLGTLEDEPETTELLPPDKKGMKEKYQRGKTRKDRKYGIVVNPRFLELHKKIVEEKRLRTKSQEDKDQELDLL